MSLETTEFSSWNLTTVKSALPRLDQGGTKEWLRILLAILSWDNSVIHSQQSVCFTKTPTLVAGRGNVMILGAHNILFVGFLSENYHLRALLVALGLTALPVRQHQWQGD